MIGIVVACVALLLSQLMDFGYGRDQGIFGVIGRAIREGGVPYRDAWDFKPPGIYFIYALGGPHAWGIRVLEAAGLCSLVYAFARVSRRYLDDSRPGLIGGGIAILTHVQSEFWHTAQPESFGAVLVAWGIAFAADATDDRRPASSLRTAWRWALSGTCYGLAALLKPTIGVAGAASLMAGLLALRHVPNVRGRLKGSIPMIVPFVTGALLPVSGCLMFFEVRGGLSDLQSALFGFAPQYVSLAWEQLAGVPLVEGLLRRWLLEYTLLNVVGLLLLLLPPPAGRHRDGLLHVGGVVTLLLAGVWLQARLFPYHFGAVLPMTALLAGWGFWRLWLHWRSRSVGVLMFALLLAVLVAARSATTDLPDSFARRCWLRLQAWTHPDQRQAIREHLYSVADYHAEDNRRAAEWTARETVPGSAILVYGFAPEIYVTADRPAASRYIYNVPQRAAWSRAQAREVLMGDLAITNPSVVLVEHGDVIPRVTRSTADSAADLQTFTELRELLASHYERTTRIGKFDIYRRTH